MMSKVSRFLICRFLTGLVAMIGCLLLSATASSSSLTGHYQPVENYGCDIEIDIYKSKDSIKYKLSTHERSVSGSIHAERDKKYLTFNGLYNEKNENPLQIEIVGNRLTFQNYGNAMNPYVYLSECDYKFIILEK